MGQKLNIALLASGNLGTLVLHTLLESKYTLSVVFTDKKSDEILNTCLSNNIPLFIGNPRQGKATEFINKHKIDVVASINYLFLIEKDIISWPRKMAFNIHGSLLPKYRGRTPHVWAIINNEQYTGITVHQIDEGCDTGAIIRQEKVEIKHEDTGADILKKFEQLYPVLTLETLAIIANGTQELIIQDNSKATYFGKRTPEDGRINWSWHKERIRNWIRAQAHPYPGAFTYYEAQKFIIDKVSYDDYGFHQSTVDGEILTTDPVRVKTPNGVLRIDAHRNDVTKLRPNKIFS